MLTDDMIRTWIRVRGNGIINEHAIAALAKEERRAGASQPLGSIHWPSTIS